MITELKGIGKRWIDYVKDISNEYSFSPPASKSEINQITTELCAELPEKLLGLYNETNGVFDSFGCPLIWATSQIVKDNLFFRNFKDYKDMYMPFNHLLFFRTMAVVIYLDIEY